VHSDMTIHSAIYEGQVRHRRHAPVENAFTYRLFMLYLDLAELPTLFDRFALWSNEGRAVARFRRRDHLKAHGPPERELGAVARDLIGRRTGQRPTGPIRMLTHLEYFRYRFNPVSFYFCFDEADAGVETIIAEINNTPWGEQHCYVLPASANAGSAAKQRFCFEKDFHISPFLGMDLAYDWRFTEPGASLNIHMAAHLDGKNQLDATLTLHRREITAGRLNLMLLKHPLMTLKVIAAIHWQAFKLWCLGCPQHPHPEHATSANHGVEL
jgi:DUF1365 family protein